jgi:ParB/RepB/Spo0J family partition protein
MTAKTSPTTFEEIPIASIAPHPRNARHNFGTAIEQAEMADSIREVGIIEPLVVAAPLKKSWRYTLIAGHRRLNGAVDAKLETVPCIIRHDLDSPQKQLEVMLIENGHRKDLTVTEEADAYQELMTFPDYTPTLLAKKVGRTRAYVENRLSIAHLPENARHSIDHGQLTIADALELAGFTDLAVVEELAEHVGTASWTWRLNQAKGDRARAQEPKEKPPYPPESGILNHKQLKEALAERDAAGAVNTIPEGRTAREGLLRTLDTAARVRHQHLASVIDEGDDTIAITIARTRLLQAAKGALYDPEIINRVVGHNYERHIRNFTLAQAVIALDILAGLQRDTELARTASAWKQSHTAGWRNTLGTIFGYEWSDAELELMGQGA